MKNKVFKNYYYQRRLFQYILISLLQIFEFKKKIAHMFNTTSKSVYNPQP